MTRLNVGNIRHPDATTDSITLTSGGDTQITGALGLGGATYGSSGQFLQSQGSGSAPQWATVSAGWTNHGQISTTSGNSATVTGISTSARVIKIVYSGISCSNTTTPFMRLYMGNGSISTADYYWYIRYAGANQDGGPDSSIRLIHTNFSSTTDSFSGIITLVAEQTHMIGTHTGQQGNSAGYWGTMKWAGGGSIDRIMIDSASNFDAGHFVVYSL